MQQSSLPLTRERLVELLESKAVIDPYPHLLRWLIWFPLLSVEELTRLEQARLAKQARSPQRVAAHLQALEQWDLITHLVVNEPGRPPNQYRYFVTDAGLYLFAAQSDPPLSVRRLVQAYAVTRTDLIARLAHIDLHLILAEFSTKLVAEGRSQGYPLVSYQQPWMQTDRIFGRRQTIRCDAAFLLAHPQGTEHAFYVRVDTDEHGSFERKKERLLVQRLQMLRHALHLRSETMPPLLILTGPSRLADWGALLEDTSEQRGTAPLVGAITTLEHLRRSGVYGATWWSLAELLQGMQQYAHVDLSPPSVRLAALLDAPTSRAMAEHFSQRRTFAHLATTPGHGPLRKTARPLPCYVGALLSQEVETRRGAMVADALRGTRAEQQEAVALLNLALSATQKELLRWLGHHPLLTAHQLATLHHPGTRDIRGVRQHMAGLFRLGLLVAFPWYGKHPWHERERYLLSDAALRYLTLREEKPSTAYLLLQDGPKKTSALALQRGAAGLFAQMAHTHGVYACMTRLLEAAHWDQMHLITWKSARESLSGYPDPFTSKFMQIRPDAEVVYQINGQTTMHHVLVEYDRATTSVREYEAKLRSYADYQQYTGQLLPPILIVTQHARVAALLHTCIERVAPTVLALILVEDQTTFQGVLPLLASLEIRS